MHKGHRSYTVTGITGFDLRFFSGKKHKSYEAVFQVQKVSADVERHELWLADKTLNRRSYSLELN